jgi:repressor LexA
MQQLTTKQQRIVDYIRKIQQTKGHTPSLREIGAHFGCTLTAAADHLKALKRKGVVDWEPKIARSLRILSPLDKLKSVSQNIPVYGSVPAGFAQDKQQEAVGCITIDVQTLGIKPNARTFALEVRGESMIGKHIMPGDYVILEHGKTPKAGDVVAALIDNESTLKTYVTERGKPFLKAENPKFPKLTPATELVIQGVMVGLVRKATGK